MDICPPRRRPVCPNPLHIYAKAKASFFSLLTASAVEAFDQNPKYRYLLFLRYFHFHHQMLHKFYFEKIKIKKYIFIYKYIVQDINRFHFTWFLSNGTECYIGRTRVYVSLTQNYYTIFACQELSFTVITVHYISTSHSKLRSVGCFHYNFVNQWRQTD